MHGVEYVLFISYINIFSRSNFADESESLELSHIYVDSSTVFNMCIVYRV